MKSRNNNNEISELYYQSLISDRILYNEAPPEDDDNATTVTISATLYAQAKEIDILRTLGLPIRIAIIPCHWSEGVSAQLKGFGKKIGKVQRRGGSGRSFPFARRRSGVFACWVLKIICWGRTVPPPPPLIDVGDSLVSDGRTDGGTKRIRERKSSFQGKQQPVWPMKVFCKRTKKSVLNARLAGWCMIYRPFHYHWS